MLGYYKRLWKNKKSSFIGIFILILIGLIPIVINIIDLDKIGDSSNVSPAVAVSPLLLPFTRTNGGMIIIGLFIIYIALVFMPRNIPLSQNKDDYKVNIKDDNIYIKFKKHEFELKKDNFKPTSLLFKDKNNKFVSLTTAYQVYNYVNYYYKDKIKNN